LAWKNGMSGNSTAVAAAGMILAGAAGGPLAQVFNELALVLAINGAAGGLAWGMINRRPWRMIAASTVLGAVFAFGFGQMAPHVVTGILGVDFGPQGATVPALAAGAFLIGLMQNRLIDWITPAQKPEEEK
jgi:hypothetical protein